MPSYEGLDLPFGVFRSVWHTDDHRVGLAATSALHECVMFVETEPQLVPTKVRLGTSARTMQREQGCRTVDSERHVMFCNVQRVL